MRAHLEALAYDAPLEFERKQAVLSRCEYARWYLRPRPKWPRLPKHDRGEASARVPGRAGTGGSGASQRRPGTTYGCQTEPGSGGGATLREAANGYWDRRY